MACSRGNGVIPYANSLDTVGILAKTRRLVQDAFEALDHYDERDPTSLSRSTRSRITHMREERRKNSVSRLRELPILVFPWNTTSMNLTLWFARHGRALSPFSKNTVTRSFPSLFPRLVKHCRLYYVLAPAEASSNLAKYDGVRYGASQADSTTSASSDLSALCIVAWIGLWKRSQAAYLARHIFSLSVRHGQLFRAGTESSPNRTNETSTVSSGRKTHSRITAKLNLLKQRASTSSYAQLRLHHHLCSPMSTTRTH